MKCFWHCQSLPAAVTHPACGDASREAPLTLTLLCAGACPLFLIIAIKSKAYRSDNQRQKLCHISLEMPRTAQAPLDFHLFAIRRMLICKKCAGIGALERRFIITADAVAAVTVIDMYRARSISVWAIWRE